MYKKREYRKVTFFVIIFIFTCNLLFSQNGCNQWSYFSPSGINCNQFEHGEWKLIFEDDFDGNQINTQVWYTCEEGWNRKHGDELQYYKDENIVVSDGIAHLEVREDPGMYPVWIFEEDTAYQENLFFQYSSAWIQTKAKYQHGLFEVKCKIPKGKGFWPAFWLFGNSYEVDVFEFDGSNPTKCHFDAHKWYDTYSIRCAGEAYDNSFFDDYHLYSLEWDEFKLVYRIDGVIKHELFRFYDTHGRVITDCHNLLYSHGVYDLILFPKAPMSIILNFAIDSDGPNNETVFPNSVDIDYVRVYKKSCPNKTISLTHDYDTSVNYYIGGTIEVGESESVTVADSNQRLSLVAANVIEVVPESDFKYGSEVELSITTDNQNTAPYQLETIQNEDFSRMTTKIVENTADYPGDEIVIMPNPSDGRFSVDFNNQWRDFEKISIVDSYGRVVFSMDIGDKQQYEYNINLTKGTYKVVLERRDGIINKTLVIQ